MCHTFKKNFLSHAYEDVKSMTLSSATHSKRILLSHAHEDAKSMTLSK